MHPLLYPIIVPFVAGLLVLMMPKKAKGVPAGFSFVAAAMTLLFSVQLFFNKPLALNAYGFGLLRLDAFSAFVVLFIALFGILNILYSSGFMKGKEGLTAYYAYILWTLSASIGAALSDNLILFISFWGFLGFTLYLLIGFGGEAAKGAAKKSFIIIGGTDALMIMAIGILWKLTGSLQMSEISISLHTGAALFAFIALALGAFAKAGAMPMHTWIPASAEGAPTPVMAFLPASLDKLLGIYFLARLSLEMFVMTAGSTFSIFLLSVGAITIIAAVMMALVQHDIKRLLGYHAVSQVGYMVLGIGTANPIGIAGGLFHMLNNVIYKSCLFFSGGSVEYRTKTTDLDRLGGLGKFMPITFTAFIVASLSISGVPPFNGFVSKWMVYQGVIAMGKLGGKLWIVWLVAAMFGSALTLASFMKLIHAIFLGQPAADTDQSRGRVKEVGASMWIPTAALALLCVVFGVFAYKIPLKLFIIPSLGTDVSFSGIWNASLATVLIIIGIAIGLFIYALGNTKYRETEPFVGGADLKQYKDMRVSGVSFYKTIQDIKPLRIIYNKAEAGFFDIYEVGRSATFGLSKLFQYLHNGILPTYLTWCLLGIIILFLILKG